jgi:hypothetical protein
MAAASRVDGVVALFDWPSLEEHGGWLSDTFALAADAADARGDRYAVVPVGELRTAVRTLRALALRAEAAP